MNDFPEILEEPLFRSPSLFDRDIPLVSCEVLEFSVVDSPGQKGPGWPSGDVPKIQEGFSGPGTSLIAEGFLYFRRKA